jgi:uncharacterized protein (DUF2267 family)
MSATGLDVFDKTIQTTHIWLREINQHIGPPRQLAWHVLGAVLRALRDTMPPQLAAHLAASLPLIVRGAFYDQYRPNQALWIDNADDFIECVAEELADVRPIRPTQAIAAVLGVLNRHVPEGQIAKVRQALPRDIRALWPAFDEIDEIQDEDERERRPRIRSVHYDPSTRIRSDRIRSEWYAP